MRRRATLVGLLLAPFLWLGAEPAAACSCVLREMPELVSSADVVARGRLVDQEYVRDRQDVLYTFAGAERFAGAVSPQFVVRSSVSSASCGLAPMVVGRQYVVFMDEKGGELAANSCGGTGPATPRYVEQVEAVTGPGTSFGGVPLDEPRGPVGQVAHALADALSAPGLWG